LERGCEKSKNLLSIETSPFKFYGQKSPCNSTYASFGYVLLSMVLQCGKVGGRDFNIFQVYQFTIYRRYFLLQF